MKITRFDHITIAVRDLDEAAEKYSKALNLPAKDRRKVKHLGMENIFFPLGDGAIELVAPLKEPDAADHVQRFLDRHGEGMMNLCLTVENIQEAIAHLETCGLRVIRHKDADGAPIAMIHPKDMNGVMIEIREGKRIIRED